MSGRGCASPDASNPPKIRYHEVSVLYLILPHHFWWPRGTPPEGTGIQDNLERIQDKNEERVQRRKHKMTEYFKRISQPRLHNLCNIGQHNILPKRKRKKLDRNKTSTADRASPEIVLQLLMALRGSCQPEPKRNINPDHSVAKVHTGAGLNHPLRLFQIICPSTIGPIRTGLEPYPDGDNPDHLISRSSIIFRQEEGYGGV